ncbi:carboxymuconolactone decarboxylase family protein [Actinomadura sp. 6N118]|uniref:carboxymuconolactone decarboxylase family protein n=1 Tax=Actinomadura sp. 6N118 TaxID=3375151 RepID=UPI0037A28D6F
MHHREFCNDIDPVWRIPALLGTLKPDATALLDTANERAWQAVDPVLLEQVRFRVASLIGNHAGLARRSRTARERGLTEAKIAILDDHADHDAFSEQEKDCLTFTEQFVIDVSGTTRAHAAALGRHFTDDQVRGFVVALYVTECTQRLEMASPALLSTRPHESHLVPVATRTTRPHEGPADPLEKLHQTLRRYQDTVVRGTALDPVTTELVRLRCARTHDCRICKTLRLADAQAAGADDVMTSKVDFYENSDLDERTKTALRITDAFITRPDTLTERVVDQAQAAFSREELAELLLDITKWSTQKIHVSLGTDSADALPKNEQGLSFFSFGEDGRPAGFSATRAERSQTHRA